MRGSHRVPGVSNVVVVVSAAPFRELRPQDSNLDSKAPKA